MADFFKTLGKSFSSNSGRGSSSREPLSLGEGDAGFGMRLEVEAPKPGPKKIRVKVKYAPANMYATLIERACRGGGGGGGAGEGQAQQPWLVYVQEDGTVVTYHFASATWHKVRFSVAGEQHIRKAWAGGGARILLELVSSFSARETTLKLWNPVTGSLSALPPFQSIRNPAAFGVSKDRIIAAGTDEVAVYTWIEVFERRAPEGWRVLGSLPRPYALRLEDIVEYKGTFCALVLFPDHHMLEIKLQGPNHLNVCDIPKVWKPTLIVCADVLYLVGVNYDDDIVRIWKLRDDTQTWEQVARPVSPRSRIEREILSIISVGNTLVFCLRSHEMMSFDLNKGSWGWLPVCPDPSFHALKWNPAPHDDDDDDDA